MSGRANFAVEVLSEKQKVFQWMRKWLRENDNGVEEAKNVSSIVSLTTFSVFLKTFENKQL